METLATTLEKLCNSREFKNLYEFLKRHDPDANAYVGQIEKRTRIPAEERLNRWADVLKISDEDRAYMLKCAAVDRVYAAAKRNAVLGAGLQIILEELDLTRFESAKLRKQVVDLRSELAKLLSGAKG